MKTIKLFLSLLLFFNFSQRALATPKKQRNSLGILSLSMRGKNDAKQVLEIK